MFPEKERELLKIRQCGISIPTHLFVLLASWISLYGHKISILSFFIFKMTSRFLNFMEFLYLQNALSKLLKRRFYFKAITKFLTAR